MNNNTLDKLDRHINIAINNLYTLSKKDKIIRLTNFSFKNKSHLAIMQIAQNIYQLFGLKLEINTSFWKYHFYNLKYHFKKNWRRTSDSDGIDVEDFITHIENANNTAGLFALIYTTYYER